MDLKTAILEKEAKRKTLPVSADAFVSKKPIVGIDLSEVSDADRPLWDEIIQGVSDFGVHVVVFVGADDTCPENKHSIIYMNRNGAGTYSPVDVIVLPNSGMVSQAFGALTVPVALYADGSTEDYDPIAEHGNGFYFHRKNKWEIFATIVRAIETYRFPYDWKNLLREIYKHRN